MLLNGGSGEGNMQISFWSGEKGKWGLVAVLVAKAEAVVVAEAKAVVVEATTEMVLTATGVGGVADDKGVNRIELSFWDDRPRIQHQIWTFKQQFNYPSDQLYNKINQFPLILTIQK